MSETDLTVRQRNVTRLVADGLTNKEIAAAIGISYETVKEHVQDSLKRIGCRNRVELAVWWVRTAGGATALVEAASKVLNGLNARIDAAVEAGGHVPAYDGIAELSAALAKVGE